MIQFRFTCFLISLCMLLVMPRLWAQQNDSPHHLIKLNLSSLVFKTASLQYEHQTGRSRSVTLGLRYGPESSTFLKERVDDWFTGTYIHFYGLNMTNLAVTPGMRFYMSRKAFQGWYISPYLRYANISLLGPVVYDDGATVKEGLFKANINSLCVGVMLGAMHRIAGRWRMDWWIAGAHLGAEWGRLAYTPYSDLSANDQNSVNTVLNGLIIPHTSFSYQVSPQAVKLKTNGYWAGFISLGIGLCYGW